MIRVKCRPTQVLVGQLFHKLIKGHLKFVIAFIEIYFLETLSYISKPSDVVGIQRHDD